MIFVKFDVCVKIQVCFFKKKHARGLFAAVEDLFNLKIFGNKTQRMVINYNYLTKYNLLYKLNI